MISDVRDTSCTTASMSIFNRFSQGLFGTANANFQPCTPGLLPIFSRKASPSEIIDDLCLTLLSSNTGRPLEHLSLHIVPSFQFIPYTDLPRQVHHPPKLVSLACAPTNIRAETVFRGGGVGQIYWVEASNDTDTEEEECDIHDAEQEEHDMVQKAIEMQMVKVEGDRRRAFVTQGRKGQIGSNTGTNESDRSVNNVFQDVFGTADERSKAFVSRGVRVDYEREAQEVTGEMRLMMVRMVSDNWENLSWYSGSAPSPAYKSNTEACAPVRSPAKGLKASDLFRNSISVITTSYTRLSSTATRQTAELVLDDLKFATVNRRKRAFNGEEAQKLNRSFRSILW